MPESPTQVPPKAIARTKKLKKNNIAGSETHTARMRETSNASQNVANIRLIGSTDPNERLQDLVLAYIGQHEQKRKIRTDAVYCVEILLTASPQYYRPDDPTHAGYWDEDKLNAWVEPNIKWLQETYGDRIVRAELHLDEATPHLHAYLVPLDDKGQLRCNHFFNGRQKMHDFQDSYHTAMAHLGLERGIKGSHATHDDIKDFYRIVEEGLDLSEGQLSPQQLQTKASDRDRAVKRKSEIEATARQLVKENSLLQARVQIVEAENQQLRHSLKQQADQLRDLPLDLVAWHLGLDRDPIQDNRWKGEKHIINIDKTKFHDFHPTQSKGGGGAIDLVMHVNDCDFRQALAWLHDRFKSDGMHRAVKAYAATQATDIVATEPIPQFVPPKEDRSKWQFVRDYFRKVRGLPAPLTATLHTRGLLYGDDQQNAVFLMRSLPTAQFDVQAATTGAFLRGTLGQDNAFKGYAKGTKRADGYFYFDLGTDSTDSVQKVVLSKSPMDALSCAALSIYTHGGSEATRTMFLAVDSPKNLPLDFLENIPSITVAIDNDSAGRDTGEAIKELLPQTTVVQPKAMDWNAELLDYLRSEDDSHSIEASKEKNQSPLRLETRLSTINNEAVQQCISTIAAYMAFTDKDEIDGDTLYARFDDNKLILRDKESSAILLEAKYSDRTFQFEIEQSVLLTEKHLERIARLQKHIPNRVKQSPQRQQRDTGMER